MDRRRGSATWRAFYLAGGRAIIVNSPLFAIGPISLSRRNPMWATAIAAGLSFKLYRNQGLNPSQAALYWLWVECLLSKNAGAWEKRGCPTRAQNRQD